MRKIFLSLAAVLLLSGSYSYAQLKIGYIDSKTIMAKLPDAVDANQKLDAMVKDWQTELRKMQDEKKAKQDDFEKRKLIMTEQTQKDMQAEIDKISKDIDAYRQKKFGAGGELFQKQEELMKPVQNKIFNAIQDVAKEQDLDFVFDRGADVLLLYAKEKYDITPQVMEKLKLQ